MPDGFQPEAVRYVRKEVLMMSQTAFARRLGCTTESVRNWEHGRASPAGCFIDSMHRLCKSAERSPPEFYREASPASASPSSLQAESTAITGERRSLPLVAR